MNQERTQVSPVRTLCSDGYEFIRRQEGLRLEMYSDSAGFPTLGFGHLVHADDEVGVVITREKAEKLLRSDVAVVERALNRSVKVPLYDHEYSALASWTFNLGSHNLRRSTLLRLLNEGNYDAVPDQMLRWVYAGDQNGDGVVNKEDVISGLRKRREREGRLWATGDYGL